MWVDYIVGTLTKRCYMAEWWEEQGWQIFDAAEEGVRAHPIRP